jgi:uncharacterized membrane protein YbhN (UPF0104 family)
MMGRRSLLDAWRGEWHRPLIAVALSVVLVGGAAGILIWKAGWRTLLTEVHPSNWKWFLVCLGGQVVAYAGYTFAFRETIRVDGGLEVRLPEAGALGSVGFAPYLAADVMGGFSVDYATLRHAGVSKNDARARVFGLSALEYAVLAPAVAGCGLLAYFEIGGEAPAAVALPWLAVVPGAAMALWVTEPSRRERFQDARGRGLIRRAFAHGVAAVGVLRSLVSERRRRLVGFTGAALYWGGDLATLWGALRLFSAEPGVAALVLAYGTGYALTRRALPLGGPGVVEILLVLALTWVHVHVPEAAAGVFFYRVFNFWLALLVALLVLPHVTWLEERLPRRRSDNPKVGART